MLVNLMRQHQRRAASLAVTPIPLALLAGGSTACIENYNSSALVDLATCLTTAAYSIYFEVATDRVIGK